MLDKTHPAYVYAKMVVNKKLVNGRYVIKQCRDFLQTADDKNKKYLVRSSRVQQIGCVLKLMIMPKGLKAGKTVAECTTGYQWLLYVASLAVVYRSNEERRRYETVVLEIARKNFKTYTVGTVFILLMLLEPRFAKFYSVAPDGSLSREVKEAITDTLRSSPLLYFRPDGEMRFRLLRDSITCQLTDNKYIPLNYSTSRMDGKQPNAFLADEVGALPVAYPVEAMRSGQLNMLNKLGWIISTKYPTIDNPFETEVLYAKRVLDELLQDDTIFALLYEPDNTKDWMKDDEILLQANPVAQESEVIWEDLLKKRARAIAVPKARENFVTKHCNIIYQGLGTESYIDVNDVIACRSTKSLDWQGREVWLGVDLAMSEDNVAVVMLGLADDGKIMSQPMAFIPEERIDEKSSAERLDYRQFIRNRQCIACGDRTIAYDVVENYVFGLEEKYGVIVSDIGYDRYNAISSAQKWENGDQEHEGFNVTEIRQHSDTLHLPTKTLKESILARRFIYERNELYEINFQNARCQFDTNMNRYVSKKKSNGKVDMTVATILAMYLVMQNVYLDSGGDDVVQTG